jgi:hypothetical protein
MSGKANITAIWLIMGHGKVYRYANQYLRTTSLLPFDIDHPVAQRPNDHYLSMTTPFMVAKAMPLNGYQAVELFFLDQVEKKTKIKEIEDLFERYENEGHRRYNTHWTIYRGVQPWEKYFTGYKNQREKDSWTNKYSDVKGPTKIVASPRYPGFLQTIYKLYTKIIPKKPINTYYKFNAALDPLCRPGRYTGHAFCRLMMISIDGNGSGIDDGNIYCGNETKCTIDMVMPNNTSGTIDEDDSGFKIPNWTMSLSTVWEKCKEKTERFLQFHYSGVPYNSRVFIYDSTCNGCKQQVPINEDQEVFDYYNQKREETYQSLASLQDEEIEEIVPDGGGIQHGGTVAETIARLEKEMDEQSNYMSQIDPNAAEKDKENFIDALENVIEYNPESKGGGKTSHSRKNTKRKFYKKTKKNRKSKKQHKTRTRNNRKTRK